MYRKFVDWFDKLSPTKRKLINVVLVIIVAVGSGYALLKFILPYIITNSAFATKSVTEAVASIAVVVTITVSAINLVVASMNKRYSSKKQLTLAVNMQKSKVIVTWLGMHGSAPTVVQIKTGGVLPHMESIVSKNDVK